MNNNRQKEKRIEAARRQAQYDALTVEEKIAKLDKQFGKGKGAVKQRKKLKAQLKILV